MKNEPNIQNIPTRTAEGKKIRDAFLKKAREFKLPDLSEIERRIMERDD